MKQLNQLIDFQNVEGLSRALKREKVSRDRFKLDISEKEACTLIWSAMTVEVEGRNRKLDLDEDTINHIKEAAKWITSDGTPGLMLMGLCGNGKTTLAKSLQTAIVYASEKLLGYGNRAKIPLYKAKDIIRLCASSEKFKDKLEDYEKLFQMDMMIIDDLGDEPKEVLVYGMIHTPLIDLISERYDKQKLTIITTNCDVEELKLKYGERIYDRFCEMMTTIVFENDSYRTSKSSS